MIRTFGVPGEVAAIAPAATSIVYVGSNLLPIDPGAVAIGLDDGFVVSLDAVATDTSESPEPFPPLLLKLAERLRCQPKRAELQSILSLACKQVTEDLMREIHAERALADGPKNNAIDQPIAPTSIEDLMREMEMAQMHIPASLLS